MLSKIELVPAAGSTITLHDSTGAFQVSRVEGFFGPPSVREVAKTAPGRDGGLDDTRYFDVRTMTIEGEILGSSTSDTFTKWDSIGKALQTTLLSRATLKVTLPDASVRQCSVVISGSAQPSFEGNARYLAYQLQLKAPDPRWYGTTLNTSALTISNVSATTSTSANVTNAGTAPSAPIFTWTPVSTGLYFDYATVTVPSAYSTINPSGSTTVLDGSAGSAAINAGDYIDCQQRTTNTTAVLGAGTAWPVLYPGTSSWTWTQQYAGSTSNSTCTLSWRDAWW